MKVHAIKPWSVLMCSKCGLAIGSNKKETIHAMQSTISVNHSLWTSINISIYINVFCFCSCCFFPRKHGMESASATLHAGAAESSEEILGWNTFSFHIVWCSKSVCVTKGKALDYQYFLVMFRWQYWIWRSFLVLKTCIPFDLFVYRSNIRDIGMAGSTPRQIKESMTSSM